MMKITWTILGFSLLVAPAYGQDVTMSDLDGVTIELHGVYQETIIRNGRTLSPKVHVTGWVKIAGNTVRSSFQTTATLPGGRTSVGPSRSSTHTLGMPNKGNRGNDLVWVFSNGTLARLVVHTAGGAAHRS